MQTYLSHAGLRRAISTRPATSAGWLGRKDSNLRIRDPKSRALPLGYAPTAHLAGRKPQPHLATGNPLPCRLKVARLVHVEGDAGIRADDNQRLASEYLFGALDYCHQ